MGGQLIPPRDTRIVIYIRRLGPVAPRPRACRQCIALNIPSPTGLGTCGDGICLLGLVIVELNGGAAHSTTRHPHCGIYPPTGPCGTTATGMQAVYRLEYSVPYGIGAPVGAVFVCWVWLLLN